MSTDRVRPGWRSGLATLLLAILGLSWLTLPIWWSAAAPSATDQSDEAPFVLAALSCLTAVLAMVWWRDRGWRQRPAQVLILLITVNTVTRGWLGPGRAGVEVVYLLPLVAGAYAGPAAGFIVGFTSCLTSSVLVGTVTTPLPWQALLWGLVGAVGGLVHLLPRWLGAPILVPLGMLAVACASIGYDLPGWSVAAPGDAASFTPGAEPFETGVRLLLHIAQTAWAVDLVRVLSTGIGLALLAYPLLRWLDLGFGNPRSARRASNVLQPLRPVDDRETRRSYLDSLWQKENINES